MKSIDMTQFAKSFETSETRAYDHALDLAYMFVDEMERQGLTKKELAERMGISQPRLSTLLNTQPNMTLETIAQFELALDVKIEFDMCKETSDGVIRESVIRDLDASDLYPEWAKTYRHSESLSSMQVEGNEKNCSKLVSIEVLRRLVA